MRVIRKGTFETNSSSTHSMVIAMENDFDLWMTGEAFVSYAGRIISKEEAIEKYTQASTDIDNFPAFEDWINTWDSELWDFDHWEENLVQSMTSFTTPNGEVIKILCAYGTDY